jgi:hypothetical protein
MAKNEKEFWARILQNPDLTPQQRSELELEKAASYYLRDAREDGLDGAENLTVDDVLEQWAEEEEDLDLGDPIDPS